MFTPIYHVLRSVTSYVLNISISLVKYKVHIHLGMFESKDYLLTGRETSSLQEYNLLGGKVCNSEKKFLHSERE